MITPLHRKRYNRHVIFLLLLSVLFGSRLQATPACPIVTQSFQSSANGDVQDASATGWYLDASHVTGAVYFAALSHRIKAQTLGGEGVWYSRVFSVSGYAGFQVDAKISSEGALTSSEYVKVFYKLDGGAETLIGAYYGNFGTPTVTSPALTGKTVQIVIRIYNFTAGNAEYYIENYDVFKETGPCTVTTIPVTTSATNSGVLTCNNPSATLSATTTATGTTTYSWTGTNGFTSSSQNPVVSSAGTYTVVATNAAGTGAATYIVTANNSAPDVTATGAALTCASSVMLHASSSVSGATYNWTGPNAFTSGLQNPTVNTAGTYTVTVKNPANGCTASQSVSVTSGTATASTFWLEDFSLPNGTTSDNGATAWTAVASGSGIYSVQNNEFKTSFNDQYEGVWTSGVINIAGRSNTKLSVDLRSEIVGSGKSFETADYIRVYYKLNGGAATLVYEDLAGIGNTTTGTASVTISSAALNGNTLQIIIKTSNSDASERYYFDNVTLTGTSSSATISTSVAGTVTCNNTAQLSVTTTPAATAYSWTGPNGFTSTLQNPVVSAGGQYTVMATLSSGCSVSAPVTVTENRTPPDITATGGVLACLSGVTLNVNSSVPGATYKWTGPNGFTSTAKNPVVSTLGAYTATVTSPGNGCTASQSVQVSSGAAAFWLEEFTQANGTTSDAGSSAWSVQSAPSSSVFSVQNNEFRISNSGTVGSTSESVWASGVIDISGKTNVSISAAIRSAVTGSGVMNTSGTYMDYIRFYYKLNGGAEVLFSENLAAINNHSTTNTIISSGSLNGTSLQIIVRARATGSDEFYYFDNVQVSGAGNINTVASAGGMLTCVKTTVPLTGSATLAGATYNWTGPNGFVSTAQSPTVGVAGIYTLKVTLDGCTSTDTALVSQDIAPPAAVTTTAVPVSVQLTCTSNSVTFTPGSSTPGVTYSWAGPDGAMPSSGVVTVSATGTYVLTATNPANGCTASASSTVTQNTTSPGGVTTTANPVTAQITCTNPSVLLTSNSTTAGVTYGWSGPNGFTATGASVLVNEAGDYTVSVTDPTNGCVTALPGTVTKNVSVPVGLSASPSDIISCFSPVIDIQGRSTTPGALFSWSGPGGYTASTADAETDMPGSYTLTVTNPANGCTASTGTIVTADTVTPSGVTASNNGPLNCVNTSVSLTGGFSTATGDYLWVTPDNNFIPGTSLVVTTPGVYTFVVTNDNNGCTSQATTNVVQNTDGCTGSSSQNPAVIGNTMARSMSGVAADAITGFQYKTYPNPWTTTEFIEFISPAASQVSVELYSSYGNREKLLFNNRVNANQAYKLELGTAGLVSGTHFCIIRNNDKVYAVKLILIK